MSLERRPKRRLSVYIEGAQNFPVTGTGYVASLFWGEDRVTRDLCPISDANTGATSEGIIYYFKGDTAPLTIEVFAGDGGPGSTLVGAVNISGIPYDQDFKNTTYELNQNGQPVVNEQGQAATIDVTCTWKGVPGGRRAESAFHVQDETHTVVTNEADLRTNLSAVVQENYGNRFWETSDFLNAAMRAANEGKEVEGDSSNTALNAGEWTSVLSDYTTLKKATEITRAVYEIDSHEAKEEVSTGDFINVLNRFYVPQIEEPLPQGLNGVRRFRRRRLLTKSVPFIRKVKVPVVTKKVVPATEKRRIKVTRMRERQDYEETKEQYTEMVTKTVQVTEKYWAPVEVECTFEREVPVLKERIVKKPVTRIVERQHWELVNIAGTRVQDIEGFRVDEVEDRKVVEKEEWEVYELRPHKTGHVTTGNVTVLNTIQGRSGVVRQGDTIYTASSFELGASKQVGDDGLAKSAVRQLEGKELAGVNQLTFKLRQIFGAMDKNEDQRVTFKEFSQAIDRNEQVRREFQAIGGNNTLSTLTTMFQQMDDTSNSDGAISWPEFINGFKKFQAERQANLNANVQ